MQGEGKEYDAALEAVWEQVKKLEPLATPPGKLSLASQVEKAEKACNEYLGTETSTFVTNATAGFEIAYKYANLKPGDEVIVKVVEIDQQGRINLSRKDALADIEARQKRNG